MGLEGLVSKLKDRPYRPGRSPHWVKVKNRQHSAFSRVVDQSVEPTGRRLPGWPRLGVKFEPGGRNRQLCSPLFPFLLGKLARASFEFDQFLLRRLKETVAWCGA